MRILFLTQWFDPEPNTTRGLPYAKWLTNRGHKVEVLTGFPNYPGGKVYPGYKIQFKHDATIDGVRVKRVPLYPSHDVTVRGRVLNYGSFALSASTIGAAAVDSADVGFVYHPPATVGLPAMVLNALRRIPFVYHIADLWPESVTESGMLREGSSKRALAAALHMWCKMVYRHAAALTVTTPGYKRILIDRGVPEHKIHVVYHWTDGKTFVPQPRDEGLAASLGMAGRFNVVYAGNLGLYQSVETVVRAAQLLRDLPAIQIVIVGTGVREHAVRALAAELDLDNVRFLERRQYWEMPAINRLGDVLVIHLADLPFFRSTIPGKTQVALSSGRPVLMAVRGDAASIVERAGAGVVCAPENPEQMAEGIRTLYRLPPAEREAFGRRGRDFYLREMCMEVGGARTEAIMQEVARERSASKTGPGGVVAGK